jgi:hypothetical protein
LPFGSLGSVPVARGGVRIGAVSANPSAIGIDELSRLSRMTSTVKNGNETPNQRSRATASQVT